ncbi:hypothetical protein [Streptomyces sp. NPDC046942]|uniref:hypothetical protein n=1 Tax=Streptomyces sp. NPDC046942 TaxID=3155137 RepID=UPI0033F40D5B
MAATHYAGTLDASRPATLRGRGLTPGDVKSLKAELAAKGIKALAAGPGRTGRSGGRAG